MQRPLIVPHHSAPVHDFVIPPGADRAEAVTLAREVLSDMKGRPDSELIRACKILEANDPASLIFAGELRSCLEGYQRRMDAMPKATPGGRIGAAYEAMHYRQDAARTARGVRLAAAGAGIAVLVFMAGHMLGDIGARASAIAGQSAASYCGSC